MSCNGELGKHATESAQDVWVSVVATTAWYEDGCLGLIENQLTELLGERALIDGHR